MPRSRYLCAAGNVQHGFQRGLRDGTGAGAESYAGDCPGKGLCSGRKHCRGIAERGESEQILFCHSGFRSVL